MQRATKPQFRVWTYGSPAIVLGCSQRGLRSAAEARLPPGVKLLDRATGGGAVLTGPWLVGVSVVLPPEHAWVSGGLVDSYRRLALLHAEVLAALGVPVRAVPPAEVAGAAARGSVRRRRKGVRVNFPAAVFQKHDLRYENSL